MILVPWDKDHCPHCSAAAVPRWWKLYRESRACPACGGKVELARAARSLASGVMIGLASTALFLILGVATDPGWWSLVLVTASAATVAVVLTWLPVALPGAAMAQATELPRHPLPGRTGPVIAAIAVLAALAAGFLVAAITFGFRDQVIVLVALGVWLGIGLAVGLLFDLPLGAATATSDRWLDRAPWPKRPWLRRLLRWLVRLAMVAALTFAFIKALTLLD